MAAIVLRIIRLNSSIHCIARRYSIVGATDTGQVGWLVAAGRNALPVLERVTSVLFLVLFTAIWFLAPSSRAISRAVYHDLLVCAVSIYRS